MTALERAEFLAKVSREVRTRLSAITGMTTVGLLAPDRKDKNDAFNRISEAARHLMGIVNDVLDMANIDANKFTLYPAEFSFEQMLDQVIARINPRVCEKHQKLTVFVDDNIPPILVADEQRLAQVIANLLSNAAQFTPEYGSIRLNAASVSEEDQDCVIKVDVTDSGSEIDETQQERLFEPFTVVGNGADGKYGGDGLRLAISKHIIEMMGGGMDVHSESGKGVTFTFTLRARRKSSDAEQQQAGLNIDRDIEIQRPINEFSGKRVLLAEDVETNREVITALLSPSGLVIDCAKNGEDAVEMFQTAPDAYDLIFMDVQMPVMDGLEATRMIRSSSAANAEKIPIIAMTGSVSGEDIEECLEARMNGCVGKPLNLDEVFNVLSRYLRP